MTLVLFEAYNTGMGFESFELRLYTPSEKQVRSFERQGLFSWCFDIEGLIGGFIVDTSSFSNPELDLRPQAAWLRQLRQHSLRVVISSGKQPIPEKATGLVILAPGLEGIEVSLDLSYAHRIQQPYEPSLTPLYSGTFRTV